MTQQLDITVADGVCRITFQRPEAFNALSEEMARGLVEQLQAAQSDDAIRVVLVTGSGPAFSAGADLNGENPVENFGEETMDGANLITRSIVGLGKPVVAAVNGIAAGVGASLCFAADLAVATESAVVPAGLQQDRADAGRRRPPSRWRPRSVAPGRCGWRCWPSRCRRGTPTTPAW